MTSKRSQTGRRTLHDVTYTWNLNPLNSRKQNGPAVARGGDSGCGDGRGGQTAQASGREMSESWTRDEVTPPLCTWTSLSVQILKFSTRKPVAVR